jgi:hypothetical protein
MPGYTDYVHISGSIDAIGSPTIIYEDNAACVGQINYTTHISPKLLY